MSNPFIDPMALQAAILLHDATFHFHTYYDLIVSVSQAHSGDQNSNFAATSICLIFLHSHRISLVDTSQCSQNLQRYHSTPTSVNHLTMAATIVQTPLETRADPNVVSNNTSGDTDIVNTALASISALIGLLALAIAVLQLCKYRHQLAQRSVYHHHEVHELEA